jgi:hypothetical protein
MIKYVVWGLLIGCTATSVPWLVSRLSYEWLWPVAFLLTPGALVALLLSGNVHTVSYPVLLSANVVVYALLTFVIFVCLRPNEKSSSN